MRLTGDNLIRADRMWRDPQCRKEFEADTGLKDAETAEYNEDFVEWAGIKLGCPYANLSGPGGHCSYPRCSSGCLGRG
jgi:hypothetical protein